MSTADPVTREVAWLRSSGDGLPALLKSAGGPWDAVQGYWPRTPEQRLSAIYVLRPALVDARWANQRKLTTYDFRLKLLWPVGSTTTAAQLWETEQQNLDIAVDLLITRIRGQLGDHTHGGRFLSVAEAPEHARITAHFEDPERVTATMLRAEMSYAADDQSVI